MAVPLDGVRVLDLSQAVSGPYAGRVLADLGADVVKVEWPRGDITNAFGEVRGGLSGLFTQMNAGKRGIGIDRTSPGGADLLRGLAGRSDVVIENFRPGVLDRAELGYETLSVDNPGLVMLSISGFGRTGPDAERQAYAPVIHAESGLLMRQAELDGRPVRDLCLALADTLAALHGAIAVLAALQMRERTGRGQHIDLSMLEAMISSDDYAHNAVDGNYDLYAARGEVFEAVGGPIMIAADRKTLWSKVSRHAGLADPSLPNGDLDAKIAARVSVVSEWVRAFDDRTALIQALEAADLPWADLRTTDTILDSPSLVARESVSTIDDCAGGRRGVVRMPYRFSDADCDVSRGAPTRGQHNEVVLADWLGLGTAEIASLEEAGVLTRLLET